MKKLITNYLIIGAVSFSIGFFFAGMYPNSLASVRQLSVQHKCGMYTPDKGEFVWITPDMAQDIIIDEMPKPMRKPKH